jgi:hypothetical protein
MLGGLVSQRLGIEAGFQLLALVYVALAVQRAWRLARRG